MHVTKKQQHHSCTTTDEEKIKDKKEALGVLQREQQNATELIYEGVKLGTHQILDMVPKLVERKTTFFIAEDLVAHNKLNSRTNDKRCKIRQFY